MQKTATSRFLSLVLRHRPELIGLTLDEGGWTSVPELLAALARHGRPLSFDELVQVVEQNDKRRYAFNADRSRIRANQGHSVRVDLGYERTEPPARLYHGTAARFLPSIRRGGLTKGRRHHVHLSPSRGTAETVGARRGAAVVLTIDAGAMHRDGHVFFHAANGVWLTSCVPARYIVDFQSRCSF